MLVTEQIASIRILLLAALPDPMLWNGPAATQLERQIEQLLNRLN